jgi:hypothetical protein
MDDAMDVMPDWAVVLLTLCFGPLAAAIGFLLYAASDHGRRT